MTAYRRSCKLPDNRLSKTGKTKFCAACGKYRPLACYRKNSIDPTGYRPKCKSCERRVVKRSLCSFCGEPGHNAAGCTERTGNGKFCGRCSGLAHRRDKPACKLCREPYESLPPPQATEQLEYPAKVTRWDRV